MAEHRPKFTARALIAALAVLGLVLPVASASAAAGDESGTGVVDVTIAAPEGVPANVELAEIGAPEGVPATAAGKPTYVAAKPPTGTTAKVSLTLPIHAYHVNLPSVTFNGARYVGQASGPEVVVRPGETSSLDVTYVAEDGARGLHATAISQNGLTLSWTGPVNARYELRRTSGGSPAARLSDGVEVATDGTTAVDGRLQPGTQYSYALFTQDHSRWFGPLVVLAGTAPAPGSTQAEFIATPTTLLATPADIVSEATTGSGVRVVLADQVPTPLLGSAVVLPISETLAGGFLGVVRSVSSDGRTLDLVAGALSDAFDYYKVAVDDFSVGFGAATAAQMKTAAVKAALTAGCGGGSGSQTITFSPSMSLGGHFDTTLDTWNFLGADVPVGASVDMALTAKVTGAATVKAEGAYKCGLELPKLFETLTYYPVPISVALEPIAEFTIGGGLEISNLGVTASGGVQVAGTMSMKSGASFSGDAMLDAAPLTPEVKVNGSVGLRVGGELILGPGAGTSDAGVIAGVSGELDPLDASFEPYVSAQGPEHQACSVVNAAFTRSLNMIVKAWLADWSWSQKVTIDALTGSTSYGGSPWYLPGGCNDTGVPPDSLFGPGVTKVDESSGGAPGQSGYVAGFVPGQNTWVLSTGLVADAVGTPGKFASTGLNEPGDPDLSALSGHPTYDAASYQVTVIPATTNLHVRYVFASEEYPEYVGSAFNDVMAVYVNGKNCATVPGTNTPVSINTINYMTNSAYYVDNSAGAAGYSTSMDGLTVPLTCSVPVTPGQPVTIRIAVADSSDDVFDSAVALVDGGISAD